MAGHYNTTVSASDMKLYEAYFEKEGHKFGNSREFRNVVTAFSEFKNASNNLSDPDGYANAEKALQEACKKYTEKRSGARTSSGIERLNTINRMMTYLPYWSMEHSRERLETAMDLPIDMENAKKLIKAKDTYLNKCDAAMAGENPIRKDWTVFGRESYEHMLAGVDQLRDVAAIPEYQGKKWTDLEGIRTKQAVLRDASATGANVSERYRATCEGKDGFFTEVNYLEADKTAYMDLLIDGERNAGNTQLSDDLGLLKHTVLTDIFYDFRFQDANLDLEEMRNAVATSNEFLQSWSEMPDGPYKEALKPMTQDYNALVNVSKLVQNTMKTHPGIPTMDDYKKTLKDTVNTIFRRKDGYMGELVDKDPVLQNIFLSRNVLDENTAKNMNTENVLLSAKINLDGSEKNAPGVAAIERILNDQPAIERITHTAVKAEAASVAIAVANFKSENANDFKQGGNELSLRNVGMTRVADLLGVGDLIARSEKVTMNVNGRKMEGCFMEFAQGVDLNPKNPNLNTIAASIDFKDNPGFNHDAANLEILDYLCGQKDRHGNNMFYKLGEPDANGKRNIVGIMGIDNDLAFGTSAEFYSNYQGELKELFFIDERVADVVERMDRDTLEYALSDLISKDQMEAMNQRLERLQERLRENKMLKLKDNEWDLKPENMENLPEAQKEIYQAGLDSMDLEKQSQQRHASHKNRAVQIRLNQIRALAMMEAEREAAVINATAERVGEAVDDVKETVVNVAEAVVNGAEAVQQKVEEMKENQDTRTPMNFRELEEADKKERRKDMNTGIEHGMVQKRVKEIEERMQLQKENKK